MIFAFQSLLKTIKEKDKLNDKYLGANRNPKVK